MRTVRFTKRLYRRTDPSRNNTSAGIVNTDTILQVEGPFKGEMVKGIDEWYRDYRGYFYWGGGIQDITTALPTSAVYSAWMQNLRIPEIWNYATGKGVGVAVLDTGIVMNNEDLPYNSNEFFIYDPSKSIQDNAGHGSHCAGLIAARNKAGKMIGTAPSCNLYICKLSETTSLDPPETIRYADAINWCLAKKDIHVISISWGGAISDPGIRNSIQKAINDAVNANKIIVCAIGDASFENDPSEIFPACFENCIAIGAVPVTGVLYSFINKHLVTVTDGFNIESYDKSAQKTAIKSGTSQSNAIVAGIVALRLQKNNFSDSVVGIKNWLKEISVPKVFNGITLPVLDGSLLLNYFKTLH